MTAVICVDLHDVRPKVRRAAAVAASVTEPQIRFNTET